MDKDLAAPQVQGGQLEPGNKTIGLGRDSVFTGAKSFAQGTKVVMEASDPKVMKEGVDMLRNGFKTAIGGKETMEKGIAMNNDLAKSKGALDKFAQGNEIMQTGMATMKEGINLFLKGEKLYLGAK
jgi:hypothetical protein